MKSKDLFQLAVRVLGLVFLYDGLSAVPAAIRLILSSMQSSTFSLFANGVLVVGWPLAVAWWLICGAPPLMRRAYPDDSKNESSTPAASGEKADA